MSDALIALLPTAIVWAAAKYFLVTVKQRYSFQAAHVEFADDNPQIKIIEKKTTQ